MKKNIDNLFKENFNGQEIAPPEMVWTNIELALKKKKERKIIPIWSKYSGVAAVLLIGIFIGKEFSGQKHTNVVPITAVELKSKSNEINTTNVNTKNPIFINKTQKKLVSNDKNKSTLIDKEIIIIKEKNDLVSNVKNESSIEKSISNNKEKIFLKQKNNLVSNNKNQSLTEKKFEELLSNKRKSNFNKTNSIANNSVISNKKNQNKDDANSNNIISNSNKNFKNDENSKNEKIAITNFNNKIAKNELINNFNKPKTESKLEEQKNQTAVIENQISKKDSIAKKPNILDVLLTQKTKKKTKESKSNKWQITPNIAPIYANSNSNNSTIDSKFDNNSKSYEKNISLGLAINYAVTKKINIRTGINKFDVGYNTNNIGFYKNTSAISGLTDSNAILSSDYTISNNAVNPVTESATTGTSFNPTTNPTKIEGTLNQKNSYLEVPLEVSYAILDKKFGINLITGFSTLFLNKNQVSILSNNNKIDLGQADNLNKIHYSTNIGLGFNYKFSKSFQINFEPMLKYQINTFTNDAGDIKPYFMGIYTGISYCF